MTGTSRTAFAKGSRWRRRLLLLGLAVLVVGGTFAVRALNARPPHGSELSPTVSRGAIYAAPDGQDGSNACLAAQPCSVSGAVARARQGHMPGPVLLMPGTYPPVTLRGSGTASDSGEGPPVVLRPAPGGQVVLKGLTVYVPHLTVRDLAIHGTVFVRAPAVGTRLQGLDVQGIPNQSLPAVVLAADGAQLVDSHVHDTVDADLVFLGVGGQPKPVENVLISQNVLGPAAVGPRGGHVDCLQIGTAAQHVRITSNRIHGCSNSSIIIKADHGAIRDVAVVNNVLVGCPVRTSRCAGYYTLYVRKNPAANAEMTDILVARNTVLGDISVDPDAGARVVGNVLQQVLPGQDKCGPWLQDNLIGRTGCTTTLPPSNVVRRLAFQDVARGDLHLAGDLASVRLGSSPGVPQDIEGRRRRSPSTPGAFEQ